MRILSKKEDNMVSSTSFGVADGIPDDEDYSVNETKSNQNKRITQWREWKKNLDALNDSDIKNII